MMRLVIAGAACAMVVTATVTSAQGAPAVGVRCQPGPGASGSPRDVEALVALINSLPKPVTIPCLVESFERPLQVFAVNSTTSLQRSTSRADPRLFVFYLPPL